MEIQVLPAGPAPTAPKFVSCNVPEPTIPPSYTIDTLADHPFLEQTQVIALREIAQRAEQTLVVELGFTDGIHLFFTEPGELSPSTSSDLVVAQYEIGTEEKPLVEIDIYLLIAQANQVGNNYLNEFKISLAHELAHAWQDREGVLGQPEAEDNAEEFGRRWCYTSQADLSILQRKTT